MKWLRRVPHGPPIVIAPPDNSLRDLLADLTDETTGSIVGELLSITIDNDNDQRHLCIGLKYDDVANEFTMLDCYAGKLVKFQSNRVTIDKRHGKPVIEVDWSNGTMTLRGV